MAAQATKRRRTSGKSTAPSHQQPAHTLQMHFIQVKVGKLRNTVPLSSLTELLRFAKDWEDFQQRQCLQMNNVSRDVAWTDALPPAVGGAPHAHNKLYRLEPHFQLVTSRQVSASTRKELLEAKVNVIVANDHTFWGPRVYQFCSSSVSGFTLFQ